MNEVEEEHPVGLIYHFKKRKTAEKAEALRVGIHWLPKLLRAPGCASPNTFEATEAERDGGVVGALSDVCRDSKRPRN